jgi:hypothetical protein
MGVVQTIGALVTIGAVVVGGWWALFRYRRQKPDLPRVNATVDASLSTRDCVDYISFEVTVTHVSGDTLTVERADLHMRPKVVVSRLTHAEGSAKGDLPDITEVEAAVLTRHSTLSGGEFISDHGIVSVGARQSDTVGYQVRFYFFGCWEEQRWTWSPNRILLVSGGSHE